MRNVAVTKLTVELLELLEFTFPRLIGRDRGVMLLLRTATAFAPLEASCRCICAVIGVAMAIHVATRRGSMKGMDARHCPGVMLVGMLGVSVVGLGILVVLRLLHVVVVGWVCL